jgi:hypothetical protein
MIMRDVADSEVRATVGVFMSLCTSHSPPAYGDTGVHMYYSNNVFHAAVRS